MVITLVVLQQHNPQSQRMIRTKLMVVKVQLHTTGCCLVSIVFAGPYQEQMLCYEVNCSFQSCIVC